jgi:hypothetical protein
LPNCFELLTVPRRIGDQVDGDVDAQRSGCLQRFHVTIQVDPLAEPLQPGFVDRLQPDEHDLQSQVTPEPKDV